MSAATRLFMKFVLLATVSCASLIACGTPADVAAVGSDVTQAPLSQSALSVISAKAPKQFRKRTSGDLKPNLLQLCAGCVARFEWGD